MKNIIIQLLGLLLFFIGTGGTIISLAIIEKTNYFIIGLFIIIYVVGIMLLVFPITKEKKIFYFLALFLSPISFFVCVYLLDIGREYGINLSFFIDEAALCIIASALISFLIIFIAKRS